MGVYEGRGQLSKALKNLTMRWLAAKGSWDDSVSEQFEEQFLGPIETDMKNAVGAMDHMAAVLAQTRRDCE